LVLIFALVGFFLSGKHVSEFGIHKSGIPYQGVLEPGEYSISLGCMKPFISRSGRITIDLFFDKEIIGTYERDIFLESYTSDAEITTIHIATFEITKKGKYAVRTMYEGDEEILSHCNILLFKSTAFLNIKAKIWITLAVISGFLLFISIMTTPRR